MSVDFKSLLSRPATEFERPLPLPAGTYHGTIASYKFDESSQKKTPFVRFMVRITSADESIPPDQLEGIKMPREMRRDFFLTDDAMYRLSEFLATCGIPLDRAIGEAIPDAINQPVICQIKQNPREVDGKMEIFAEIASMAGTANKD